GSVFSGCRLDNHLDVTGPAHVHTRLGTTLIGHLDPSVELLADPQSLTSADRWRILPSPARQPRRVSGEESDENHLACGVLDPPRRRRRVPGAPHVLSVRPQLDADGAPHSAVV